MNNFHLPSTVMNSDSEDCPQYILDYAKQVASNSQTAEHEIARLQWKIVRLQRMTSRIASQNFIDLLYK